MGKINESVMKQFMHIRGDIAEMGVNHGSSSKIMIPIAEEHDKVIWLYDSFRGMPSSNEKSDLVQYPEGRFGTASADAIIGLSDYKGMRVVCGWLPESIISKKYCFVYLDLDHYEGTKKTLGVLWHRIITGGGILCDDYFPKRRHQLATRAIDEFVSEQKDLSVTVIGDQILLLKVD